MDFMKFYEITWKDILVVPLQITVGDIGTLFKIRIGHTNSGLSPSWHCKEVPTLPSFARSL